MHKKLALTPPMGWNSWDCYGAAVNEEQLLANADYMAKHLKTMVGNTSFVIFSGPSPLQTAFTTTILLPFVWMNIHALFHLLNASPLLQVVKASSLLQIIYILSDLNSVFTL